MNNVQNSKRDSYERIALFNKKYAVQIATINEYTPEQSIFDLSVEKINKALGIQTSPADITSQNIADAKSLMANTVIKYALRGMVKAKQTGNTALANMLDIPVTHIKNADKALAVSRARDITQTISDNLAVLTNITAANVTEIQGTIDAYDNTKDKPRENAQARKASGTDVLPAEFSSADEAIGNMYSLLRSYFTDENVTIPNEFKLAMGIINTGIRHNIVDLVVLNTDSGTPAAGVLVTDESNGKVYTTNADGKIHIPMHKNGKFLFTAAAAGKETTNFSAHIKRSTLNEFTIKMSTATQQKTEETK